MNCDQAFERLTSSEHPHGWDLQAHLAECPRCRQMQETLSPALSLFAGIEHPGGFRNAPPVFLSTEAVQVAEQAARQLSIEAEAAPRNLQQLAGILLRSAALLVVGALLTVGTLQGDKREAPQAAMPSINRGDPCLRMQIAQAAPTAAPFAARNAVLSCVACHLTAAH